MLPSETSVEREFGDLLMQLTRKKCNRIDKRANAREMVDAATLRQAELISRHQTAVISQKGVVLSENTMICSISSQLEPSRLAQ